MRLEFDCAVWSDTPLDAPVPASHQRVIGALLDRRVVFFTGAGTSVALPTGLPSGPTLAARIVEWLDDQGMGDATAGVANVGDLGQVAAAVESRFGRPYLLRRLDEMADWRDSRPNVCHFVLAMLFAEGYLAKSFTANWDPMFAKAAACVHGLTVSSPCDLTMLEIAVPPLFVHVHGQIEHPESLVATTADLERPRSVNWVQPQLHAALIENDFVFVGFGAEPDYVVSTLETVVGGLGRPLLGVVANTTREVFVKESKGLATVAGLDARPEVYVQADAGEFFSEALRSVYRRLHDEVLANALVRAREVDAGAGTALDDARAWISEWLLGQNLADALARWWTYAAVADIDGDPPQPVLRNRVSSVSNMLATLLLCVARADTAECSSSGYTIELTSGELGLLHFWPVVPRSELNVATAYATTTENSSRFSHPGDAKVPLILVCGHTFGAAAPRRVSLVADEDGTNLVTAARLPADILTLDEIARRIAESPAQPATLSELVRL